MNIKANSHVDAVHAGRLFSALTVGALKRNRSLFRGPCVRRLAAGAGITGPRVVTRARL